MRLDAVEVKVTIAGDRVEPAVDMFGLSRDRPEWRIYFAEDVARLTSPRTPLLDAGVILRAREKPGGRGDSTVKLRPARRSQLTDGWLGVHDTEGGRFRIEANWAGTNKVLSMSLTADHPADVVPAVAGGDRPVSALFTDGQRRLLDECAGVRLNLDALVLLGPISARRWTKVPGAEAVLGSDVKAERWTLHGGTDFLELSIVPAPDTAVEKQAALEKFVSDRGFVPAPWQIPKTSLVLEELAASETAG